MLVSNNCAAFPCLARHITYRRAITDYMSHKPPPRMPVQSDGLSPYFAPALFESAASSPSSSRSASPTTSSRWTAVLPLPITRELWHVYSSSAFVLRLVAVGGVTLVLDDKARARSSAAMYGHAILSAATYELLQLAIDVLIAAVEAAIASSPPTAIPAAFPITATASLPPLLPYPHARPQPDTMSPHVMSPPPHLTRTHPVSPEDGDRSVSVVSSPSHSSSAAPVPSVTHSSANSFAAVVVRNCYLFSLCRQPSCSLPHSFAAFLAAHLSRGQRHQWHTEAGLPDHSTTFRPTLGATHHLLASPTRHHCPYLLCLPLPCLADCVMRLLGESERVSERVSDRIRELARPGWVQPPRRLAMLDRVEAVKAQTWLHWWVGGEWAAIDAYLECMLYLLDKRRWYALEREDVDKLADHMVGYVADRSRVRLHDDELYCLWKRGYATPLLTRTASPPAPPPRVERDSVASHSHAGSASATSSASSSRSLRRDAPERSMSSQRSSRSSTTDAVPATCQSPSVCYFFHLCRQPSCSLPHSYTSLLAAHLSAGHQGAWPDSQTLPRTSTTFEPVFNTSDYLLTSPLSSRCRYLLCLPLPALSDAVLRFIGDGGRVKERLWQLTRISWTRIDIDALHEPAHSNARVCVGGRLWLNWWIAGDVANVDSFLECVLWLMERREWTKVSGSELNELDAHMVKYVQERRGQPQKMTSLRCLAKRGFDTPLLHSSASQLHPQPQRRREPHLQRDRTEVPPPPPAPAADSDAHRDQAWITVSVSPAAASAASAAVPPAAQPVDTVAASASPPSAPPASDAAVALSSAPPPPPPPPPPALDVSSPHSSPDSDSSEEDSDDESDEDSDEVSSDDDDDDDDHDGSVVATPAAAPSTAAPLIESTTLSILHSMRATGQHLAYSSDLEVPEYSRVRIPFIRVVNRCVFASWPIPALLRDEFAYQFDASMLLNSAIESRWAVSLYVPKRKDAAEAGEWCNVSVRPKRQEGEADDGDRAHPLALDEPLAALIQRARRVEELLAATRGTVAGATPTSATARASTLTPPAAHSVPVVEERKAAVATVRAGAAGVKKTTKRKRPSEMQKLADYLGAGSCYHAPSPVGTSQPL